MPEELNIVKIDNTVADCKDSENENIENMEVTKAIEVHQ